MAASRVQDVIGDTTRFLDTIFGSLAELGIDVSRHLCDHVCYRVGTKEEYERKKADLALFGSLLSESVIGGRPVATYKLHEPIPYGYRRIPCVELPSPKESSSYATGLQHAEFVIDEPFDSFIRRHGKVSFDTSAAKKPRNPDVSVSLPGPGKLEVKFHHQALEVVIEQELAEAAPASAGAKAAGRAGKRDGHGRDRDRDREREDIHDFRGGLVAAANHIVFERMPAKVLFLHSIYTSSPDLNLPMHMIHDMRASSLRAGEGPAPPQTEPSAKRQKQEEPKGKASNTHCNHFLVDLVSFLKTETTEMVEMLNIVKVWIQLSIPRIEDGNNFGVGIQEETVNELGRAEESGFTVLESITKYFVTRAKLVSKVQKHSDVEDYVQCLRELDEKEYLNLRLCILDLRNHYAILHDMIMKNIDKIKTPRSSNHLSGMI